MITSTTSGVWELDDTYAKINAERWRPSIASYELYMWGWGANGMLGQNDVDIPRSSPVQIPGTQWSSDGFYTNYRHTVATKTDGTLWTWGQNLYGQLGQSNTTQYSSPVQVPGTQWNTVGGGYHYITATKTDGTLWAWGYGGNGNLGANIAVNRSSPIQIAGTQWARALHNGYTGYFGIASKTDGTLWTWGYNTNGELGQNDTIFRSSPIQIPGTQWNTASKYTIAGTGNSFLCIKTDGTLWTWGNNAAGYLGQNNRTYYSSPVQIPGTQWSKVTGGISLAAIKTDGTLWVWGYGASGGLGQNNTTSYYSSPVQIPGTQWDTPYGGYNVTGGTKTDGTLWLTGDGTYGRLGLNSLTKYSSPVQIPGTEWYGHMSGPVYAVGALKQVFTY